MKGLTKLDIAEILSASGSYWESVVGDIAKHYFFKYHKEMKKSELLTILEEEMIKEEAKHRIHDRFINQAHTKIITEKINKED